MQKRCAHCENPFEARVLAEHEGNCLEAQIKCPNVGCGITLLRRSLAWHRGGCGREEVACPNAVAGCSERVLRMDAARHASQTCVYREVSPTHFILHPTPSHLRLSFYNLHPSPHTLNPNS